MAAEATVSIAVETLGKLLIEKAVFLKGVKGEVKRLRNELRRMQCFLKDAAKKQSNNYRIKNWISEIREVAHDAEDAIEIYSLSVQNRGMVARFICFPKHLSQLYKVGKEIESIRKRLQDIEDSRERYGIQNLGDHHQRVEECNLMKERRKVAYWRKDKDVVGLEMDVELLLGKAFFHKSEGLSVATISGMGGIGKSTLASKIYNHPDVVRQFEYRIWVVVSSEFTPHNIMKQILQQLGVSPLQENLEKELYERLTGKRYFIVLDDVWEAAHLRSLTDAFPDDDNASRLLLTSRNQVVTMHNGYVHSMKVLDANQSWELFLRKAFVDNTNGEWPEKLKDVGEEILKKCGGLPLAISVVGSLLATKRRLKSEWEEVLKDMKYHMDKTGEDINIISAILELSYQNLPPELKACFLCLAFSKEDATLKAKNLVHIWVAQGLVRQEDVGQGEVMEDVARSYLNKLISRNMIQVKEMKCDQVRSCHVHDLVRDLSIRKAKEEIDFEVEGNSHQSLGDKPRHRAMYCSGENVFHFTNRNHYLRSLFIHVDTLVYGPSSSYWKSFELLRVLDMGLVVFEIWPKAIGRLTGLRYLKMNYGSYEMKKLPRSWAKLKNLEILHLKGEWHVMIDEVIMKMDSLRHLYLSFSFCSEVGLEGMRNLQTLSYIRMEDSDLWQIQGMGVSKLGFDMRETSDSTTLFTCLATLKNLVCLTLRCWRRLENMEGIGALHRITKLRFVGFNNIERLPVNFPPNLSYLTFKNVKVTVDPMPILETLPKLLHLHLHDMYVVGVEEMVVSSRGFPCLKVLHLEQVDGIRNIEIEEDAMAELNQFIVSGCGNLSTEKFPEHIISAMANAH